MNRPVNRPVIRRERRSPARPGWGRDLADTAGYAVLFVAVVWGLPAIPDLARLLARVWP